MFNDTFHLSIVNYFIILFSGFRLCIDYTLLENVSVQNVIKMFLNPEKEVTVECVVRDTSPESFARIKYRFMTGCSPFSPRSKSCRVPPLLVIRGPVSSPDCIVRRVFSQGESTDNFNWGVRRLPLGGSDSAAAQGGAVHVVGVSQVEESVSEQTPMQNAKKANDESSDDELGSVSPLDEMAACDAQLMPNAGGGHHRDRTDSITRSDTS